MRSLIVRVIILFGLLSPTFVAAQDVSFAGIYSGTYSGGDNGTWTATISATGVVTASAVSISVGPFTASGIVLSTGLLTLTATSIGATFNGTVNSATGAISGTWTNSFYGISGTWSGIRTHAGAVPICTLTASASTIYLGSSAILTATCNPAAMSYAWTPAAGLVAGSASTATVTPTVAGIYQYSVAGINGSGTGNTASATVTMTGATFVSQSDCFFNWTEITYPSFFAPAAISNPFGPYYFRYYAQNGAYLATSSADNQVYYFGPLSSNAILGVGALSGWVAAAGCQ